MASALADNRLTFDEYRRSEHPYVEQWWGRHWDLAGHLLDEPDYSHIRINVFDAEDSTYRYVVTATEDTAGTIVLIEFQLID